MDKEIIKAGRWIFTEGGVPEYFIYKLLRGKVSIHKSARKIREVEITENMKPIMLGITAVLRDDRAHMASVRAETDIEVERIAVDQIRGVLANEIPGEIKYDLSVMINAISLGNEIESLMNRFFDLPEVDFETPENLGEPVCEILSEIKRLYKLISVDVGKYRSR